MHDCIEDTSATYAEIAKEFSPAVADLVEGVSKLTRVQYASKEEEQMENLRKMLMAMAKDMCPSRTRSYIAGESAAISSDSGVDEVMDMSCSATNA